MMNHVSRRRTTAAVVPQTRPIGVETLANVSHNPARKILTKMSARYPPWPWCTPPSAESYNNQPSKTVSCRFCWVGGSLCVNRSTTALDGLSLPSPSPTESSSSLLLSIFSNEVASPFAYAPTTMTRSRKYYRGHRHNHDDGCSGANTSTAAVSLFKSLFFGTKKLTIAFCGGTMKTHDASPRSSKSSDPAHELPPPPTSRCRACGWRGARQRRGYSGAFAMIQSAVHRLVLSATST
jgi:hypothetical protein